MDPLQICLVVLVVVAIWALVELALTIKKARSSLEIVARSANDTIEQVQPLIAKADGMVDDLQPSVKKIDPIMTRATTSIDLLNTSLGKFDGILDDVSDVSGAASSVTNVAGNVVDTAANAAAGLVSKISGFAKPHAGLESAEQARLTDGTHAVADKAFASKKNSGPKHVRESSGTVNVGYVTIGDRAATEYSVTATKDK